LRVYFSGIPEALRAETPSGQINIILSILYMKLVKNTMKYLKYKLCTIA